MRTQQRPHTPRQRDKMKDRRRAAESGVQTGDFYAVLVNGGIDALKDGNRPVAKLLGTAAAAVRDTGVLDQLLVNKNGQAGPGLQRMSRNKAVTRGLVKGGNYVGRSARKLGGKAAHATRIVVDETKEVLEAAGKPAAGVGWALGALLGLFLLLKAS